MICYNAGMQWATKKKAQLTGSIVLVLFVLMFGGWYFFIYTPSSCGDRIQNQDEENVDCGGVCDLMCKTPRVDALWSRATKVANGVYHGTALVKNPLSGAKGVGLTYSMALYDTGNILVAERRGTFDIDPGETRVIFEANVVTSERVPVRAFMKIDGGQWTRTEPVEATIRVIPGTVDQETLRYPATIENTTSVAIYNVIANAILYDAGGILVASSETLIPVLAPRERKEILFTWALPFVRLVITSDILVRVHGAR